MPRPAPRVAPATRATRPVSGFCEVLFLVTIPWRFEEMPARVWPRHYHASMRGRGHASKLLLQSLTPGVLAAFIAAVIVLVATIVLGFRSVQSLYQTHESIALAYQTRVALDRVLATLLDAETGERGYVITNNPSYLDPYARAREAIDSNLAQLRGLMADDPDQQVDLAQLAELADRKLAELESVITLRRDGTFDDAQAEVAKHLGKTLMDDMRVVVARMEERE